MKVGTAQNTGDPGDAVISSRTCYIKVAKRSFGNLASSHYLRSNRRKDCETTHLRFRKTAKVEEPKSHETHYKTVNPTDEHDCGDVS